MISLLKSVMRHRPPQPTVFTSTPFDVIAGAPGAVSSITASHVPASCVSTACSGPGLGTGISWAPATEDSPSAMIPTHVAIPVMAHSLTPFFQLFEDPAELLQFFAV